MKKTALTFPLCLSLLCLSLPFLGLLAGCAPAADLSPPAVSAGPEETATPAPDLTEDEVPAWVSCRVVDGAEEGRLLLAELDHGLNPHEDSRQDGRSVYALSTEGLSVFLDGEPAQASDLQDGMSVEISFNGEVLETFPAQLGEAYEIHAYSVGTRQNPGGGYYDLCGLYLQVLDDLWERDEGLNSDISLAGLDLSEAPGELLESEKAAIAWRFGEDHGVDVVRGSFEELAGEEYFTEVNSDPERPLYQWEDGCLFTISANTDHEEEIHFGLAVLFFDAQKWRSPLGAYWLADCSAVWSEMGGWSGYNVGHEAIS